VRHFELTRADASPVRPAARLTTRPAKQIYLRVRGR
jgi:hypothetical protein